MKLYAFLGRAWGMYSYYVMSNSLDNAIESVIKQAKKVGNTPISKTYLKRKSNYQILILNENNAIDQEIA